MAYGNRFTQWVYRHSPIFAQNLEASVWGWKLNRQRYGKYYDEYLALLKEWQWRSEGDLRQRQDSNLRQLIDHAYATVPYYRDLFRKLKLKPADIKTSGDLGKIPILEKATVRQEGRRLCSTKCPARKTRRVQTSGTSGIPLTFLLSQNCYEREYAFREIHYSWAGFRRGDALATLGGGTLVPPRQQQPPFWRYNRAGNQTLFSARHMSPSTLPFYIAALSKFQPALINGFTSAIFLVGRFLIESRNQSIRPKAVFTSSETLQDFQRETIERAFGCRVFDWYGNTECVAHTTECERGGLHNQLLHSVIEIVDRFGEPAGEGKTGVVVGTGLDNWAMPLIRYRVGDAAVATSRTCACGRGYPLIEKIMGRIEDYILTPERRYVPAVSLTNILDGSPGVREAQVIQESLDLLRIQIVQAPGFSGADARNAERNLRSRLGDSMRFQIEAVPEIKQQASGKRRFFVSRISREEFALFPSAAPSRPDEKW